MLRALFDVWCLRDKTCFGVTTVQYNAIECGIWVFVILS